MRPPRHETPRQAHDISLVSPFRQGHDRRSGIVRALEAIREWLHPRGEQRIELLETSLADEVELVAHAASPAGTPPASLRKASMNGTMAPSITFCTSGIFSSLRWSLTSMWGSHHSF